MAHVSYYAETKFCPKVDAFFIENGIEQPKSSFDVLKDSRRVPFVAEVRVDSDAWELAKECHRAQCVRAYAVRVANMREANPDMTEKEAKSAVGATKKKAMFARGAVGVWLNCGGCWQEKECGIYPKGHPQCHERADGGDYNPRRHQCPHCRSMHSFYTEEELADRKKRLWVAKKFDYGLLRRKE